MGANQILIYQSKQGMAENKYYTYYCYLKDKEEGTEGSERSDGNVWLIYIPGPVTEKMKPVIFDLQDKLEPTFTKGIITVNGNEPTKVIVSVSTGNFDILRDSSGNWETVVNLKNTSFNLAVDDYSENTA